VVQLTISSYVNTFDGSLNWNIFFEEGVLFAAGSLTPGQNSNPQCAASGLPRQHRRAMEHSTGYHAEDTLHGQSPGR
jgi:hypothetical protein